MAGVTGETRKDRFSGAGVQIDHQHFRTHKGEVFTATISDGALAAAANLDILIRPGPIPPHMQAQVAIGADGRVQFFENPVTTADGTPVPSFNRLRGSTNTSNTLVFNGPTVTGTGLMIDDEVVPGGQANFAVGGQSESFNEYILNPAFDYLVRLTNVSGGPTIASVTLLWYEIEGISG